MLSGFYSAASGILLQQRTLNVLGNNIANVNTPGYRADRVVSSTFEFELMTRLEKGASGRIGVGAPLRLIEEISTIYEAGSISETQRPMDLAITGEGFFSVQGEEGTYLTRGGNFELDNEGYLILPGVGRVMGEGGPLQVKDAYFTVEGDGRVLNSKGQEIDRLALVKPQGESKLKKYVNGLYQVAEGGNTEPANANCTVYQGALERSNVDMNREYTLVMEASRAFQACSQALKIVDELNQKSASQIASI